MTGEEIYGIALSFVFERKREDADYEEFFPTFLNTCMQEALAYENLIRRKTGKTVLTVSPKIEKETMNEELDFAEALCRTALPYGVAAFYCQDDGDNYRAADYRARFITACEDAALAGTGAYVSEIEDAYYYGEALEG